MNKDAREDAALVAGECARICDEINLRLDVDNLPHPGEVLRLAAVSIRDEFGVEWPA